MAQKRRKTAGTASYKPGSISLSDDQATRSRRTTVLEWSDDDEDLTARLPSMKEPSLHAEVPVQRAKEIPVQSKMEVLVVQTTRVPEQQTGVTSEQHV